MVSFSVNFLIFSYLLFSGFFVVLVFVVSLWFSFLQQQKMGCMGSLGRRSLGTNKSTSLSQPFLESDATQK